MASDSYKLQWEPRIKQMLADGTAEMMKDASGLLIPVAKENGRIVGLPRMVESAGSSVLGAGPNIANMLGQAYNAHKLNRLQEGVDLSNKLGVGNAILGVLGIGLNYVHHKETRRQIDSHFAQTREILESQHAESLNAHGMTQEVIRSLSSLVGAGFESIERLGRVSIWTTLTAHLETSEGIAHLLSEVQDLGGAIEQLDAGIRKLSEEPKLEQLAYIGTRFRGLARKVSRGDLCQAVFGRASGR